jgi:plasmid replication initiation protein
MTDIVPAEIELIPDYQGRSGTTTVRAEVNMLSLPFFALNNRDVRSTNETVYEIEETDGDQTIKRSWRVTGSQHLGHPAPFDKQVFRGIEAIIDQQGYPVQNPISFTTYELLKKMDMPLGGRQYAVVRQSIDRIISTTIIAKNVFWRKEQMRWHGETFHIYERCTYQGEQLPNGNISEKNNLYLHPLYLESINARYVKPLDYEYYKSLKRPLAQRLYELLGYKFYGAFKNDSESLAYKYDTLCQLLPMKKQAYQSSAKRCMDPAHEELIRTGFLAAVVWKGWRLYYVAGQRALDEFRSLKAGRLPG